MRHVTYESCCLGFSHSFHPKILKVIDCRNKIRCDSHHYEVWCGVHQCQAQESEKMVKFNVIKGHTV